MYLLCRRFVSQIRTLLLNLRDRLLEYINDLERTTTVHREPRQLLVGCENWISANANRRDAKELSVDMRASATVDYSTVNRP